MFFLPSSISKDTLELGKRNRFSSFRLQASERQSHLYLIGLTGKGKSKLLEHILFQDITNGRGCGVLDPHGSLIADLLAYLHTYPHKAQKHLGRIIYVDPTRNDFLVPFNVLDSGLPPNQTADMVVEAFQIAWSETLKAAPRFKNILQFGILTLIANNLSLVELPKLLTDSNYRISLLQNVQDEHVLSFWQDRYEAWGKHKTPEFIESVLNKITALTLNPQLRLMLGAKENRLRFNQIMDAEQVLLVDLGRCTHETERLVGALITTSLVQQTYMRIRKQVPFYFCIDEFQDFCINEGMSNTLAKTLSECRKYGLHLTLAHQTLSQVDERIQGALGNVQTKVVFGVSRSDAERLAKDIFRPTGEEIKEGDSLGRVLYYSLQEEWEKYTQLLQTLTAQHAYVQSPNREEPIKIKTIPIQYTDTMPNVVEKLQLLLARQSGKSVRQLSSQAKREEEMRPTAHSFKRFTQQTGKPHSLSL